MLKFAFTLTLLFSLNSNALEIVYGIRGFAELAGEGSKKLLEIIKQTQTSHCKLDNLVIERVFLSDKKDTYLAETKLNGEYTRILVLLNSKNVSDVIVQTYQRSDAIDAEGRVIRTVQDLNKSCTTGEVSIGNISLYKFSSSAAAESL